MKSNEISHLESRIKRYRELEKRRAEILTTLTAINRNDPEGPHQQGPFTSNTRESRNVDTVRVFFSKTLGGSDETELTLLNLGISASAFGRFLESELRKESDELLKLMEAT